MSTVYPIAKPVFDVKALLQIGQLALSKNLASQLDSRGLSTKELPNILCLLDAMREGRSPREVKQSPGPLLDHFQYSFAVLDQFNCIATIAMETRLAIHHVNCSAGTLAIISGSLTEWCLAFANMTPQARPILNQCQLFIEKDGFVIPGYEKKFEKDGTFYLEEQ